MTCHAEPRGDRWASVKTFRDLSRSITFWDDDADMEAEDSRSGREKAEADCADAAAEGCC